MLSFAENEIEEIRQKYSTDGEYTFWARASKNNLFSYEREAVEKHLGTDACILDIGCGCGREAISLSELGHKVWALDVVPKMVEATRSNSSELGLDIDIACGDFSSGIPFDQAFDAVLCFEQVYQHITEQHRRLDGLRNIKHSLNSQGVLLLSILNDGDIDLWGRFQWLRMSGWRLAKLFAWDNINLLHSRYTDESSLSKVTAPSIAQRLRLVRWIVAYFIHLSKQKTRMKWRRIFTKEHDAYRRKTATQCSPGTISPGSTSFAVLNTREAIAELNACGYSVLETIPFLNSVGHYTERAKRGAPIVLIVAKPH